MKQHQKLIIVLGVYPTASLLLQSQVNTVSTRVMMQFVSSVAHTLDVSTIKESKQRYWILQLINEQFVTLLRLTWGLSLISRSVANFGLNSPRTQSDKLHLARYNRKLPTFLIIITSRCREWQLKLGQ